MNSVKSIGLAAPTFLEMAAAVDDQVSIQVWNQVWDQLDATERVMRRMVATEVQQFLITQDLC